MKPTRHTNTRNPPTGPVSPTASSRPAARREPPPQRAMAQGHAKGAAEAIRLAPAYGYHPVSRGRAVWRGSLANVIASIERFRALPSLAALEVSIHQQLTLTTDAVSGDGAGAPPASGRRYTV